MPKVITILEVAFTFVLVNIGWVFFRANTLKDAFYILAHMFQNISFNVPKFNIGEGYMGLLYCFVIILFMEFVHLIQEHRRVRQFLDTKPIALRWSMYLILLLSILLFGVFENTPFIYFQF